MRRVATLGIAYCEELHGCYFNNIPDTVLLQRGVVTPCIVCHKKLKLSENLLHGVSVGVKGPPLMNYKDFPALRGNLGKNKTMY